MPIYLGVYHHASARRLSSRQSARSDCILLLGAKDCVTTTRRSDNSAEILAAEGNESLPRSVLRFRVTVVYSPRSRDKKFRVRDGSESLARKEY